jgi:Endonuclease-reverse transcriptase
MLTKTSLPCVIAGDLNCGHIDWASLIAPSDGVQDVILKFVVSNGFAQTVCEPTRGENILDIVLCNEPLSVFDTAVLPPFGCSDHNQVEFSFLPIYVKLKLLITTQHRLNLRMTAPTPTIMV